MSTSNLVTHIHVGKPMYPVREYKTLKDMLLDSAKRYRTFPAYRYRNSPQSEINEKMFPEVIDDMNALGSALVSRGLKGKKIAMIGENRYEWVLSYLASINGIGVTIPLDRMLPENEIETMLIRAEVDVLFYSDSFSKIIENFAQKHPNVLLFVKMNEDSENMTNKPLDYRFVLLNNLLIEGRILLRNGYSEYTDTVIDSEALQVLLFTSGTSSTSKAVMLSHRNLVADVRALAGIFNAEHGEPILSVLPLHHTFENTCTLLFGMYHGMTVAFSDGLKYLSKNMTEHKPAVLVGVPLLFEKFRARAMEEVKKAGREKKMKFALKLTKILGIAKIDIRKKLFSKIHDSFGGRLRVIIAGGAPMNASITKWYESIGIKIYQGYGLTETAPVIAGCNDRVRQPGTCGQPLPGVEMGIENADITGTGEIVVKGPMVMQGYWNDEDSTREVMRDGWFHTGDLGRFNRKGLLQITGRSKSVIVLQNGKNVFPEELEALLVGIAYVKESLVWGEMNDKGVTEVCARVVIDRESISDSIRNDDTMIGRILAADIKDINSSLSSYKTIRHFVFGDQELAKTTTLKVKRYIEINELHTMLTTMSLNFVVIAGKNIDRFKEAFNQSVMSMKKISRDIGS